MDNQEKVGDVIKDAVTWKLTGSLLIVNAHVLILWILRLPIRVVL